MVEDFRRLTSDTHGVFEAVTESGSRYRIEISADGASMTRHPVRSLHVYPLYDDDQAIECQLIQLEVGRSAILRFHKRPEATYPGYVWTTRTTTPVRCITRVP